MHSYPIDSPQAAARIVVLFALADGNLCREELEGLRKSGLEDDFGLAPGEFSGIVRDFCEDLMLAWEGRWSGAATLEPDMFRAIFGEVRDPALRRRALRHALVAVAADERVSDGESSVLAEMSRHWGGLSAAAHHD